MTHLGYARIAFALAEVRKYLIPDSNDTIRQEQLREIMAGKQRNSGGLAGGLIFLFTDFLIRSAGEAGQEAIAKIKQKAQYK